MAPRIDRSATICTPDGSATNAGAAGYTGSPVVFIDQPGTSVVCASLSSLASRVKDPVRTALSNARSA